MREWCEEAIALTYGPGVCRYDFARSIAEVVVTRVVRPVEVFWFDCHAADLRLFGHSPFDNIDAMPDGSRVLNMIHQDDVVQAIQAALTCDQPHAIYNVVDDEPVRQRDMFQWLAKRLDRPFPPPAPDSPSLAGRKRAGNKRVLNRLLRTHLAVTLRHPTFREGFNAELARPAP